MFAGNRFFFALKPPRDVARRIVLEAERRAPGDHQTVDRLHSTIGILDDRPSVSDGLVAALMAVGQGIAADPFICMFDRVVSGHGCVTLRPSRRIGGLVDLFRQIEDGMGRAGVKLREGYTYSPHITLSYRADGGPFSERIQGHCWLVEDVVLIHSLLGRTEHRELGRWRLSGEAGPQLSLF